MTTKRKTMIDMMVERRLWMAFIVTLIMMTIPSIICYKGLDELQDEISSSVRESEYQIPRMGKETAISPNETGAIMERISHMKILIIFTTGMGFGVCALLAFMTIRAISIALQGYPQQGRGQ